MDVVTKHGKTVQIFHSKKASVSPAFKVIMEGYNYLTQYGQKSTYGSYGPIYDDEVIFATTATAIPTAVIIYRKQEWIDRVEILMIYVKREYRREGIAAAMYGFMVEKLKEEGILRIVSGAKINNEESKAFHISIGMKEVAIEYEIDIQEGGYTK